MKKKNLTAAEGLALGERYLESGKTRREIAAEAGVTVPMVQYWASKIRRAGRTSASETQSASKPSFVQLVPKDLSTVSYDVGATLEMPCARLRFDRLPRAEYVADLVVEVARRTRC